MIDSKAIYAIFKSIIADKAKEDHKPTLVSSKLGRSNMSNFSFLPWQKPVLFITVAMLLCLVSSYDIEQAEQSRALYCENVKAKVWPAYDKDIKCKD